jgi:hypothetical protein
MCLDGYVRSPNGERDSIRHDPATDFAAVYAGFDTVLLGRPTYELTQRPGAPPCAAGWRVIVFSHILVTVPHLAVLAADGEPTVADSRLT